jgi:phosphoribosylanthranilate isomerase
MRVKICGLMRPRDVEAAVNHGADAVGFVVGTPISRRNLRLEKAKKLIKRVPVFTSSVAVTAASNPKTLENIVKRLNPDALQVHRYDLRTMNYIHKANPELSIIVAIPIQDSGSILDAETIIEFSDAIIAETPNQFGIGGTGRTHDWELTRQLRSKINPHPLILAGGLTPNNVKSAIEIVRPYGVDVSTGVESRPGAKDHRKMKEFIEKAKEAAF